MKRALFLMKSGIADMVYRKKQKAENDLYERKGIKREYGSNISYRSNL